MRQSLLALAITLSLATACSPTRPSEPKDNIAGTVRESDEGRAQEETKTEAEVAAAAAGATVAYDDAAVVAAVAPPPPAMPASIYAAKPQPQPARARADGMASNAAPMMAKEMLAAPAAAGYTLAESEPVNTEHYAEHKDNPTQLVSENPVSTFSIDVDTGSYSNVRRMLMAGQRPPADSVRAEEMINYFDYGYAGPATQQTPFRVSTEIAPAPWNSKHELVQIGIQGYSVDKAKIPASNLVFLIDTSGSMESEDKLPLLKRSFSELVKQLRPQDRVSIVVYAGSACLVLPPTPGDQQQTILAALDHLSAGGSTNGGAGIQLAYAMAKQSFISRGVNRVILATDGDFNVGTVDQKALETLIADQRKSGIALTTLGFGTDNYNDAMAEQLADIGNGNHAYIDSINEGRKVLVEELSSTMLTIAADVKIQLEFNPAVVAEYRLIGYENRALRREDFNNDKVDAGEIGAGHDVTALYEITLVGSGGNSVDPLRYGKTDAATNAKGNEIGWLRLRYKQPGADSSQLLQTPLTRTQIAAKASDRMRWATAVAAYADLLRGGKNVGHFGWDQVHALAASVPGTDRWGYRAEFLQLIDRARTITQGDAPVAVSE
ncbi:MAG TPA: VWA domain-containing protein [Arenimonas sp.]|uniref:vWA domain-containing protein n=1 Tax=Arenimonas sp. TaxID=1872635 RepID=UPI002B9ABBC9|nr:VWA domain-containing protein [Arenimonas sp.]HMB57232.1 VWA domain-containing protein [Arenimonas sp.]